MMDKNFVRRIAVFGGTFNPVHNGHLHLLRCFSELISFDKVILIPANVPPHKQAPDLAPAGDRLAMCRLAAAEEGYEVSDLEISRGGPSFTVDTLRQLKKAYPDGTMYFIMGEDMFLTVEKWYGHQEIFQLAVLCAASRSSAGMAFLSEHARFLQGLGAATFVADIEYLPVSSTMVREAVKNGRPVKGLVPPQVERYLMEKQLYQGAPD